MEREMDTFPSVEDADHADFERFDSQTLGLVRDRGGLSNASWSAKALLVLGSALMILGVAFGAGVVSSDALFARSSGVKNVIFFISDGCGPVCISALRGFNDVDELNVDSMLIGQMRTRSASSIVTDSAAGATAYSCAERTTNLMVGTSRDGSSCVTVLEAAGLAGMKTGIVATSRITHATPASFTAHVVNRNDEADIAVWQIEQPYLNLMLGGGWSWFKPQNAGGRRTDQRDLLYEAVDQHGWHQESSALDLRKDKLGAAPGQDRVIALFSADHMPYEINRQRGAMPHMPSLSEMTSASLEYLQRISGHPGFFVMIEASRIDHALHVNDPATMLREAQEYDLAMGVALEFARHNHGTLVVGTSDHDTGGLAIGGSWTNPATSKHDYVWLPDALHAQNRDLETIVSLMLASQTFASEYRSSTGIDLDQQEHASDKTAISDALQAYKTSQSSEDMEALKKAVLAPIHHAARVGFTTTGHTGVDVLLFAHGPSIEDMRGSHPNFHLGKHLFSVLELEDWREKFKETAFWRERHLV